MGDRRTALFGAVAWWFARRWLRRRAALAIAGVAAGATARRGRIRSVLGAILLVGVLVAGFVVWRRLAGAPEDRTTPVMPPTPDAEPDATAAA